MISIYAWLFTCLRILAILAWCWRLMDISLRHLRSLTQRLCWADKYNAKNISSNIVLWDGPRGWVRNHVTKSYHVVESRDRNANVIDLDRHRSNQDRTETSCVVDRIWIQCEHALTIVQLIVTSCPGQAGTPLAGSMRWSVTMSSTWATAIRTATVNV